MIKQLCGGTFVLPFCFAAILFSPQWFICLRSCRAGSYFRHAPKVTKGTLKENLRFSLRILSSFSGAHADPLAVPEKIFALFACSIFSTAAPTPASLLCHRQRSQALPLPTNAIDSVNSNVLPCFDGKKGVKLAIFCRLMIVQC